MKRGIVGILFILLLTSVIFGGYSAIQTLNGNPLDMPKAEKLANDYLKQAYPNLNLKISNRVYEVTYGRYLFEVEDSHNKTVNQLIVRNGLDQLEDTNLTKDLNESVKEYITTATDLSLDKMEVNGTAFFSAKNDFNRVDDLWISFSNYDWDAKTLAEFGKRITNWSSERGLWLKELTIDYYDERSLESVRLHVDQNALGEEDYTPFIVIRNK